MANKNEPRQKLTGEIILDVIVAALNEPRQKLTGEIILDVIVAALTVAGTVVPSLEPIKNSQASISYGPSASALSLMESDYLVPGLSAEQITEIGTRTDVASVLPYFTFGGSAEAPGGDLFPARVNFLADGDHMKLTPYFPERFVGSYDELAGGKIYVDSLMAASGHLTLGSSFSLLIGEKRLDVVVAGITDIDPFNNEGGGVALLTEEAQSYLMDAFFDDGEQFKFTGAYVSCSDKASFYDYVKDYLPENDRPTLEDYGGDPFAYQSALEAFESGDYSQNIVETETTIQISVSRGTILDQQVLGYAEVSISVTAISLLLLMAIKIGVYAFLLRNVENGTKNYRLFWKLEHIMGPLTAILGAGASLLTIGLVPGALSTLFVLTPVVSLAIPLLGYGISLPVIKKVLLRK